MLFATISATLLLSGAVGTLGGPCELATRTEVLSLLGSAPVAVPPDQIGEETAPYCLWSSEGRRVEAKVTVWSANELPVLNLSDAESYFSKLREEYPTETVRYVEGLGERAFEAEFVASAAMRASGTLVVLKTGRVAVFEFVNIVPAEAQVFAANVTSRL